MNRRRLSTALFAAAMSSFTDALVYAQQVPAPRIGASAAQPAVAEWRRRRIVFAKTLQGVRSGDPAARQRFDDLLIAHAEAPLSYTPLENLDYLAAYYVPREGVERCFQLIVRNQILGWYDALRFASESGRSEIVNNAGLFKGVYLMSKTGPALTKWIAARPDEVVREFAKGIVLAERWREKRTYDERWPQAYGLERLICADGGGCEAPAELPQDKWDEAWGAAKQRVAAYYQIATPSAPAAVPAH